MASGLPGCTCDVLALRNCRESLQCSIWTPSGLWQWQLSSFSDLAFCRDSGRSARQRVPRRDTGRAENISDVRVLCWRIECGPINKPDRRCCKSFPAASIGSIPGGSVVDGHFESCTHCVSYFVYSSKNNLTCSVTKIMLFKEQWMTSSNFRRFEILTCSSSPEGGGEQQWRPPRF
jgi:hypothetical protein